MLVMVAIWKLRSERVSVDQECSYLKFIKFPSSKISTAPCLQSNHIICEPFISLCFQLSQYTRAEEYLQHNTKSCRSLSLLGSYQKSAHKQLPQGPLYEGTHIQWTLHVSLLSLFIIVMVAYKKEGVNQRRVEQA